MPQTQASKAAPAEARAATDATGSARLLVLLLAFAWGFNWIAAAIALPEVPPWSLRFAGAGIGALTLFTAALLTGHNLHVPRGERVHVMVASLFNVTLFQVLSAFAQTEGETSRAIIIAYSMPIWATVLSRWLLRERLNGVRWLALALCVGGLAILTAPLMTHGVPHAVLFALGCAFSWAFATVYVKWMKLSVPPLANAAWQLLFGFGFIAVGTFLFDGYPRLWPVSTDALLAVAYVGVFGVGLAHFLWWSIVGKLSPVSASIGALLVPVIGVVASTFILGERPSAPDIIGFALIFAAAASVLLQPNVQHTEMPE